ncbi:MAG: hypothetical protein H0V98_05890 [Chloroflexia bacterium]|nr:hypothetical protein [Chloroflexia bacterium]
MEAVELRTLDGPNLFMLRPAIKIEIAASDESRVSERVASVASVDTAGKGPEAVALALRDVLMALHERAGMPSGEIVIRQLEEEGHIAVAYQWTRRGASRAIGHLAWRIVSGKDVDIESALAEIESLLAAPADAEDVPEMFPESERTLPAIGITGTNGKTTTTRLTASILRRAGKRVGWTSSSGVMIDDKMVMEGDWTGPSGARRVFDEPGLDVAVLETARGGILLRGLGYERNDVSVMTNISADHMGMHGVYSLDVLTEVKAVVSRVTREDGYVVLNADDARVLAVRDVIAAKPFLFSRDASSTEVDGHIRNHGWALLADDEQITWRHDGQEAFVTLLTDVPITFDGRAAHMVENALAAAAACLAIGLSPEEVRDGLRAFRNRPEENKGRLNVFDKDGATVVVDFAHNEAGLEHLLRFSRSFCGERGRLVVAIGTAGDRDDNAIEGIGRVAAEFADAVIIKDSEKYLRGREVGEMPGILRRVVGDGVIQECPNERSAFYAGLDKVSAGDTFAVMCIEDSDEILGYLEQHANPIG